VAVLDGSAGKFLELREQAFDAVSAFVAMQNAVFRNKRSSVPRLR